MKKCLSVLFKTVKWIFIVIFSVIVLFLIVRFIGQRINNRTPEGGINETMYVDINGTQQWINIYGQNKENPVLLYLHGGPGSATSDMDYPVLRKLSDIYTVVNWDQRDAGHNWNKQQSSTPVTYEQLFSDGEEMTKFLLDYMHTDKITVMGISWGAAFGANMVLDHPEYYDKLIALSWPVDNIEIQKAFKEQALEWTKDDPEFHKKAENIITEQSVYDSMTFDEQLEASKEQYSIEERYCEPDSLFVGDVNLISAMIFNPYWSLKDYYNIYVTQSNSLNYDNLSDFCYYQCMMKGSWEAFSVLDRTEYKVPVYTINGNKDYTIMPCVVKEYFDSITAPDKAYYEVEGGHYMPMLLSDQLSETVHEIAGKKTSDQELPE